MVPGRSTQLLDLMRIIAAVIVTVAFPALAADALSPSEIAVSSITLKAPLSRDEAFAIATLYFERHIPECGALQVPEDHDIKWKVTPRCGYAGQPNTNQIEINKNTGAVSWKNGPSFVSPSKLLKNEP